MTAVGPADLRVLLVSAVAARDPHSGDVTYTEQLLANPPPGVTYTTYDRAVADGTLREVGSRGDLGSVLRERRIGTAPRALGAAALRRVEAGVRSTGRAFREPIRVLEADPAAYDVVHVHVFNTRFVGASPPVVMSAAGPLDWVYGDAWGWAPERVRRANWFDDRLAGALDATLHARRLGRARRFVAFSAYLRDWVCRNGFAEDRVDVVPNYLTPPPASSEAVGHRGPRRRLGFIAKDFESKGGKEVLAAYRMLRAERHDVELVVVGSTPPGDHRELASEGITWRPFVPRDELLREVLPSLDVLLHPSHVDGLPYTPMEALAHGVPLVVSDYRALPEMVHGGAGRVCRVGDVGGLARAASELLAADVHARARTAARERFHTAYSSDTQAPALRLSYERALASS